MWRDVFLIVALVLAVFTYFGLTPKRVSSYFGTLKTESNRQRLYGLSFLLFVISISIAFAVLSWQRYHEGDPQMWTTILYSFSICELLWLYVLIIFLRLTASGIKRLRIIGYSIFVLTFIASLILSDMHIWEKIVYPIAGYIFGYSYNWVASYVERKIKAKRLGKTKDGDHDPL